MKKIAILVENSRAYGRGLIEGIADYAQENGDWMLRPVTAREIYTTDFKRFDGIIARIADDRLAEKILASKRPAVDVVGQKNYPGLAAVDTHHTRIAKIARSFFAARGFKNFAFCGFPQATYSDLREKAFATESTYVYAPKNTQRFTDAHFYNERLDKIPDARSLKQWLKHLPKPVAVFCCNDLRAIQLQRVALDNGWRVPQDVSILGVDNDTIVCSFAEVPISSIDPNAFEVGRAAARILDAILAKKPEVKHHKVYRVNPGEITERMSTDFMPIDPPWLGEALLYIERNISKPMTATDVCARVGRSFTFVGRVFRQKLGMSILAYISARQMREARRLMLETNLRLQEVAFRCGFTSQQYFCRKFSVTYKISPTEYRLKHTR